MSEQKSQSWPVPLRVRFRPATERLQGEHEHGESSPAVDNQALQLPAVELAAVAEHEPHRRAQQIKELIRLGNLLRAEMGLNEVLQQIVTSISACTGFRILVINLVEAGSDYVLPVAIAGASAEGERIVRESRMTVEQLLGLMRPNFRISQSYFISHEHAYVYGNIVTAIDKAVDDYVPGGWHPEDSLLVPLFSPRDRKKLLGFLSLDDPEDGKVPTLESIEVVELFANQAALAIDNARIFQEREAERLALEEAIVVLRRDLERIQQGDLRVRVRSSHEKLQPVAYAINEMVSEISEILGDVQVVTRAVDEHATEVQQGSNVLVHDASQQEQQVHNISHVIDEMAATMHSISERAGKISQVAVEAMDVTLEGQSAVDRAVDGMGQVREVTMQSARVMKRLGESGQEINDTVLTISDLTARMNLLALNAAIEAVRAGEQGQGFALIAQEIRTLAVHSAEAARKVSARIRTIQQETATVALSVEQNTRQVVMQTELVTQTGVALEAISVVTEQMANLVQDICAAAESEAQGSQLIARSVEGISRMTSEITRHMRQMQQSLASLVELTNSLHSRVSVFRISASGLHPSEERERRNGDNPHGAR
jgi:methyl-accepting chemotaxis protein